MDNAVEVKRLLRQQAAVASFGSYALSQTDLQKVLTEAARVCAAGLSVRFCKVCQYRPDHDDLLIIAGCGWNAGVVGNVISRADVSSPQGRAFVTGEPSICNDLRKDSQLRLPSFYAEHGVVSTIDVLIKGDLQPYGVLEVDSDEQRDYGEQDIVFLTGFANVLAEAVATAERTEVLRSTIAQMKQLVEDKDRLLQQKKVLAQELQHRVRNNLQLISGMLTRQLDDTSDEAGKRGIKAIARRVSTLAQVHNHLLGSEMSRTTEFGAYVTSLCASLKDIHASPAKVTLTCKSEVVIIDLDVVTALGIVVTELVSNSYEHAFPDGIGAIGVTVRRDPGNGAIARMIISDNGQGFEPKSGSKRHGLGLVRRLAEQIRGTAHVASSAGTTWTIDFPVPVTEN